MSRDSKDSSRYESRVHHAKKEVSCWTRPTDRRYVLISHGGYKGKSGVFRLCPVVCQEKVRVFRSNGHFFLVPCFASKEYRVEKKGWKRGCKRVVEVAVHVPSVGAVSSPRI